MANFPDKIISDAGAASDSIRNVGDDNHGRMLLLWGDSLGNSLCACCHSAPIAQSW